MTTCTVGEIAEQVRGVTYKKADASKTSGPGTVGIVRAGNIQAGELTLDDLVFVPSERVSEKQMLRRGDVLIAASSGSLDVVGKAARVRCDQRVAFGGFCKVLRPGDKVDAGYFSHFFQTADYRSYVSRVAAGANINNLKNSHLDDIEIPLPPIEEQRRIAAVLDAADVLRTKRHQALAKLDTLARAIFIDMFGDPVRNERGWPISTLGQLCLRVQIGPFGSLLHKADYVDGGVPIVNPMHIVDGKIVPRLDQTVALSKYEKLQTYMLAEGDVVMGRRGEMGRCAIVGPAEDGFLCGSGSLYLRPDTTKVSAGYIAAALSGAEGKRRLEESAQGVTMPNLNSDIVESFAIGVPPQRVQAEFEAAVDVCVRATAIAEIHRSHLDNLFASLQQRAFEGQL